MTVPQKTMGDDGTLRVLVQCAAENPPGIADSVWHSWVAAAVAEGAVNGRGASGTLTIRLVDAAESERLNSTYRDKAGATNVLAFAPAEPLMPLPDEDLELGDLAICLPVVRAESTEQGKSLTAHLAHLTVHGTLHLLGFDHDEPRAADTMERLEVSALRRLGHADPYAVNS